VYPEKYFGVGAKTGQRQEKVLQNAVMDLFAGYSVLANTKRDGGIEYPYAKWRLQ
jgi:hypothetical protein